MEAIAVCLLGRPDGYPNQTFGACVAHEEEMLSYENIADIKLEKNKAPMHDASGPDGNAFFDQDNNYTENLRRSKPTMLNKPVPNSVSVPGSGTTLVVWSLTNPHTSSPSQDPRSSPPSVTKAAKYPLPSGADWVDSWVKFATVTPVAVYVNVKLSISSVPSGADISRANCPNPSTVVGVDEHPI